MIHLIQVCRLFYTQGRWSKQQIVLRAQESSEWLCLTWPPGEKYVVTMHFFSLSETITPSNFKSRSEMVTVCSGVTLELTVWTHTGCYLASDMQDRRCMPPEGETDGGKENIDNVNQDICRCLHIETWEYCMGALCMCKKDFPVYYNRTKNSPDFLHIFFLNTPHCLRNERKNDSFGPRGKHVFLWFLYLPVLYLRVYLFQMRESQAEFARTQLVRRL